MAVAVVPIAYCLLDSLSFLNFQENFTLLFFFSPSLEYICPSWVSCSYWVLVVVLGLPLVLSHSPVSGLSHLLQWFYLKVRLFSWAPNPQIWCLPGVSNSTWLSRTHMALGRLQNSSHLLELSRMGTPNSKGVWEMEWRGATSSRRKRDTAGRTTGKSPSQLWGLWHSKTIKGVLLQRLLISNEDGKTDVHRKQPFREVWNWSHSPMVTQEESGNKGRY